MNNIVVLGGAGGTGKAAARELVRRGSAVRVVGRTESRLREAFPGLQVELCVADLETGDGAARALAGCDTAVMTLGLPYTDFRKYPALMRNIVNAAENAGVRRFVLVTAIYPYGVPLMPGLVTEDHPRKPVAFKGRMRLEQEQILQQSKLTWLVLRLPDFFGPDAELSYARTIEMAARSGKSAQLFVPYNTPHQFVYTGDTGPVVADLLAKDAGWNGTYHFAGSGTITVEEFARLIYIAAGAKFRKMDVPTWLLRVIGLFSPFMREFVEMQYLQQTPVNLSDDKLVRHLGSVRRTSYQDGIAAMLARPV